MVDSMEYNAKKYPIIHLYEEWELSPNIIKTLITCGITNKAILRQMHQHDLNDIFPKRSQIGDKIFFRCKLQAWREEYRHPPLICCDTNKAKTSDKMDVDMDDLSISPISSRSSSPEASSSLPKAIAMPLLAPLSTPTPRQEAPNPPPHVQPLPFLNPLDMKPKMLSQMMSAMEATKKTTIGTPSVDFTDFSRNFEDNFDLETELKKSFQGQKILENYRKYKILGKSDQNNLTRVVANFHLMTKMPLSAQIYMFYASKIQELFPTERDLLHSGKLQTTSCTERKAL
uniref:Uncharacterized protein n=1 Tax=Lutzomyia longipalpis TaxID=7200 RepID=A0A1B0CBY4_LUTLO